LDLLAEPFFRLYASLDVADSFPKVCCFRLIEPIHEVCLIAHFDSVDKNFLFTDVIRHLGGLFIFYDDLILVISVACWFFFDWLDTGCHVGLSHRCVERCTLAQ